MRLLVLHLCLLLPFLNAFELPSGKEACSKINVPEIQMRALKPGVLAEVKVLVDFECEGELDLFVTFAQSDDDTLATRAFLKTKLSGKGHKEVEAILADIEERSGVTVELYAGSIDKFRFTSSGYSSPKSSVILSYIPATSDAAQAIRTGRRAGKHSPPDFDYSENPKRYINPKTGKTLLEELKPLLEGKDLNDGHVFVWK